MFHDKLNYPYNLPEFSVFSLNKGLTLSGKELIRVIV